MHQESEELTNETAAAKQFERQIDPENLDEQAIPDRIVRYFNKLRKRAKGQNNHLVLGDYICQHCNPRELLHHCFSTTQLEQHYRGKHKTTTFDADCV